MPRIISYTPPWLSRPSPGFNLFADTKAQRTKRSEEQYAKKGDSNIGNIVGPSRSIAHRGAEVFVVVGNQIRWADLSLLKDGHEQSSETPSKAPRVSNGHTEDVGEDGPDDGSYRVLKITAIHGSIRQISISSNGKLLAIATSHTVHLAILPDSSHLGQLPNKVIKLKTSTVGRSIHVVSQSPISNILWHPCGVGGSCLVTVTTDATIRLWEFNEGNRYALDTPSLAIDLRKLAMGTSDQGDFTPDRGKNRAFSSDSVGMEVASACFGGTGSSSESPWSALTLWVAMKAGDVYALCPLCPAEWQAPATMLPSLSTSVVTRVAALQDDSAPETEASMQYRDQYAWVQDVDGQQPMSKDNGNGSEGMCQVYRRPKHLSPMPKLQGPFQMTAEDDGGVGDGEDLEFSDICIIASKIDRETTETGDESDSEPDADENELSATLVCLMTKSGRVYICLDLEGVEGQWLPRKQPTTQDPSSQNPYLIVLEGLDTFKPNEANEGEWPTFSPDVDSRYSFFTTHSRGIYFFSLNPWLPNLEKELQNVDSTGVSFRLDIFRNGPGTLRENILSFKQDSSQATGRSIPAVPACVVLEDSDLGYFLLTARDNHPQAATLDRPFPHDLTNDHLNSIDEDEGPNNKLLPTMDRPTIGPTRSAYQPADAFYVPSDLASLVGRKVPARHKHLLSQPVRLSPATLDLMTEAHRALGRETHLLGVAAADLFRRCERLTDELKDQIDRVQECAVRTEDIIGADGTSDYDGANKEERRAEEDEGEGQGRSTKPSRMEERLHRVREKQVALQERHEALKRKVHGAGGRNLSEKEKSWKVEVERTGDAIREGQAGNEKMRNSTDEHGDTEMEIEEDEDEEDEGEYDDNDNETNGDGNENDAERNANAARNEAGTLQKRLQEVQQLRKTLLAQARDTVAAADATLPQNRPWDESQLVIPQDIKARKMAQVMALLDRESTLVEAASKRLEKLNLGVTSS